MDEPCIIINPAPLSSEPQTLPAWAVVRFRLADGSWLDVSLTRDRQGVEVLGRGQIALRPMSGNAVRIEAAAR